MTIGIISAMDSEHRQLVEAIAQRNAETAQQKAREHIENAEQTLLLEMDQLRNSG